MDTPNLTDTATRKYMLSLTRDAGNGEDGDEDGMPAVSVVRPDYVTRVRLMVFGGWKKSDGHEVPTLEVSPIGRVIQVTDVRPDIAAREYQQILTNPAIWKPGLAHHGGGG